MFISSLCFLSVSAAAGADVAAIVKDTQVVANVPGAISLAWWMPEGFWAALIDSNPAASQEDRDGLLEMLRPYTVVAIVDGTMSSTGVVMYKSETWIRANAKLVDAAGTGYPPKSEVELDEQTRGLLKALRPLLDNILGPVGRNMHLLFFPAKTADGKAIADAVSQGSFKVKLADSEFGWKLPVPSLMPTQTCVKCGLEGPGNWNYCPECGTKFTRATDGAKKAAEGGADGAVATK